jgi:hypothetical protein
MMPKTFRPWHIAGTGANARGIELKHMSGVLPHLWT